MVHSLIVQQARYEMEKDLITPITAVIAYRGPIPVAARSKAWVCGRSFLGIAGSNPAEGMDVGLL